MPVDPHIYRFYFITDDGGSNLSPLDQVKIAIEGGATIVQYRNKSFRLADFHEAEAIGRLCRQHAVPFIINDNVLLARAVGADGIHLGQEDESPALARRILGPDAIVGLSVSNLEELKRSDLAPCDYIGCGPTFPTGTKTDAKAVHGLAGLREIAGGSSIPVVAIGGITAETAPACFQHGASGVAVISYITRAENPAHRARRLAEACHIGR